MATFEQGTIEQSSLHETPAPDASRDAAEAIPLVTSNHKKYGKKKSVLIKSKAAVMIFIWTALMSIVYGTFLIPENYFLLDFLLRNYNIITVTSPLKVSYLTNGVTGSCIYAVFAFGLLFYPLAGYLADVRYGRYKVVRCSVCTMWCGLLTVAVIGVIVNAIMVPILIHLPYPNFIISVGVVNGALGLLFFILLWIAFAGFLANVIQFGVDQLNDSPSKDSFLFIHWFLFTLYIGISFGKLIWSAVSATGFLSLFIFGLILLVELICVPVTFCVAKRRWFVTDTGIGNPYKEVARVVGFARRNKIPIQRSAFTFWEDDIPTGLDLGKDKYGGPFTTEQVENVKSFFGIVFIFLALGLFFMADIAAEPFLNILKDHMDTETEANFYSIFANGTTLYPVFLVVFVPIFLKFIHPLLQKCFPGILRRIGIGLCLITVSLFCSLFVDTIGHCLPGGQNATSVFAPVKIIYERGRFVFDQTLHLSPYFLFIQQVLVAVAYVFIYGGVFEFICAQSPHSMKGFLIGIFFAIKGLFQLIGVLGILLPFSFWQTSPKAGLVYFLVNIVISVAGVVAFIVAAKRYHELCNVRKYIEEVYEKDVRHNVDFEDLDVHFQSGPDTETEC
ncbi:solute carrier family 15 member 4-like [Halichondria panicea]|uniref:solute carrier family 15 member 4-like n=1 Tax=Halichondria panicea TaxID=6063 RepID=UPI00312B3EF2